MSQVPISIDYTNWKGNRRVRIITPLSVSWGSTTYHPKHQWLLKAVDNEDGVEKDFALEKIHSFNPKLRFGFGS